MAHVRFPPRSALPRGIAVERVPLLGTTWYERGFRYWLRRVLLVVVSALILALVAALLRGFFGAIRRTSVTGFWVALAIEVVYSLAVVVFLVVRTKRRWHDLRPVAPKPVARPAGSAGAVLGTLARSGLFVGQVVLVLATLVFVGLYVALFLAMLMPETIWERPARLALADRLRDRGVVLP
ncbi:MAG TPA: hypothetical protein VGL06_12065 [Pseudonocardiaceae bacterium]